MRTTLDRFGRIVIPKKIRKDLGIETGAEVTVEERGRGIYLEPVQDTPPLAVKDGVLVYRGSAEGDLAKAVADEREKRARKLRRGLGQ